jgi:hypothetical protein
VPVERKASASCKQVFTNKQKICFGTII